MRTRRVRDPLTAGGCFGRDCNAYRDFGSIRLEDNVVVTETGHRVLG